jgi:hypothetical protein
MVPSLKELALYNNLSNEFQINKRKTMPGLLPLQFEKIKKYQRYLMKKRVILGKAKSRASMQLSRCLPDSIYGR